MKSSANRPMQYAGQAEATRSTKGGRIKAGSVKGVDARIPSKSTEVDLMAPSASKPGPGGGLEPPTNANTKGAGYNVKNTGQVMAAGSKAGMKDEFRSDYFGGTYETPQPKGTGAVDVGPGYGTLNAAVKSGVTDF